jgi:hypothetical protein
MTALQVVSHSLFLRTSKTPREYGCHQFQNLLGKHGVTLPHGHKVQTEAGLYVGLYSFCDFPSLIYITLPCSLC